MTISLTIPIAQLIEDVGRTAAYSGAKTDDYARLSTTEADATLLMRMVAQAANAVGNALKRNIVSEQLTNDAYKLELEVSASFDPSLQSQMQSSLANYMTMAVTSRWLALSQRDEAGDYGAVASEMLTELQRYAASKRRPSRPQYQ